MNIGICRISCRIKGKVAKGYHVDSILRGREGTFIKEKVQEQFDKYFGLTIHNV